MKIFLIRHGQTTGDIEDRFGGDYDDHLTPEGKLQSDNLGKKLADKGIEAIFASPRIRAQETASIVGNILGVDVETIEDIRERNAYGILTGMVKSEAKEKHPKECEDVKSYKNCVSGAEKYEDFKTRILKAFEDISSKNFKTIAIITHGGPISCFFREVIGREIYGLRDCGYVELDKGGSYEVIATDGLMIEE